MKLVRTLFLASAIFPLMVGTTLAAELHGKAKPRNQANGCGAYGAGFRPVPGSDACVKIGGWVRAQSSAGGHAVNWSGLNTNNLGTSAAGPAASGYITTDVRTQTGYGTLRAYLSAGADHQ